MVKYIMKISRHLFSLILLLLCYACCTDPIDLTGIIVGTVTDASSGEPLSGVSITISPLGETVTTGSDGKYVFRDVPASTSTYSLQAKKSDYQTDEKSVKVEVGGESRLDFHLFPSTPKLFVSHSSLDFGNEDKTLSFDISNNGYATLNWTVSENVEWLSCNPTSGIIPVGQKTSVVVTVNRSGLNRGSYSQTIAIASNGGSASVRVNMSVQGATLSVTPEYLDFGATDAVKPLSLKNTGTNTQQYVLKESNNWIKLEKKSGYISASEIQQIMVSVDRSGMDENDYSGSISITAGEDQMEIPVKMNVPSKSKPIVSLTINNSTITTNSVELKVALVSVGSSRVTRYGFCWSKEESPTVDDSNNRDFGDSDNPKESSATVRELEQSTTYYVRAYAENLEGIVYSNQEQFTTLGIPTVPTVETGQVSGITSSQALVSGVLTSLGNVESVTAYGHVWSANSNPTIDGTKNNLGEVWSTGPFTSTLTGLKPNVAYHVRAYATNEKGTSYGEDVVFTTDYGAVVISTIEATEIMSKGAKVGGRINDKGGHTIVEQGVCWAENSQPTISDASAVATTTNNEFFVFITGLMPKTKYHVRAYVKNSRGDIYYGNSVSFTTPSKEADILVEDYENENYWEK